MDNTRDSDQGWWLHTFPSVTTQYRFLKLIDRTTILCGVVVSLYNLTTALSAAKLCVC